MSVHNFRIYDRPYWHIVIACITLIIICTTLYGVLIHIDEGLDEVLQLIYMLLIGVMLTIVIVININDKKASGGTRILRFAVTVTLFYFTYVINAFLNFVLLN